MCKIHFSIRHVHSQFRLIVPFPRIFQDLENEDLRVCYPNGIARWWPCGANIKTSRATRCCSSRLLGRWTRTPRRRATAGAPESWWCWTRCWRRMRRHRWGPVLGPRFGAPFWGAVLGDGNDVESGKISENCGEMMGTWWENVGKWRGHDGVKCKVLKSCAMGNDEKHVDPEKWWKFSRKAG